MIIVGIILLAVPTLVLVILASMGNIFAQIFIGIQLLVALFLLFTKDMGNSRIKNGDI